MATGSRVIGILGRKIGALKKRDALEVELAEAGGHSAQLVAGLVRMEDQAQLARRNSLSVETSGTQYFNLTTSGRYRFNFDARFSLELGIADLYWDLSQLYFRFDSEPSLDATSRSDYGIVTGLRYKFF